MRLMDFKESSQCDSYAKMLERMSFHYKEEKKKKSPYPSEALHVLCQTSTLLLITSLTTQHQYISKVAVVSLQTASVTVVSQFWCQETALRSHYILYSPFSSSLLEPFFFLIFTKIVSWTEMYCLVHTSIFLFNNLNFLDVRWLKKTNHNWIKHNCYHQSISCF